MDSIDYAKAILRAWWLILLCGVLGVAGGAARNDSLTPVYSSSVTFYISTPSSSTSSAFSSDQFAQSRANTYALLLSSERVADLVIGTTPVNLTARRVMGEIHASVPLNSVLVTAVVDDTSAARALQITTALAQQFGPLVDSLDNTGTAPTVQLSVVSGPFGSSHPIAPRTRVNLAIGLLAGLVVGLAGALLLDSRRRRSRRGLPRGAATNAATDNLSADKHSPDSRGSSTASDRSDLVGASTLTRK